jgi:hypothetical protein
MRVCVCGSEYSQVYVKSLVQPKGRHGSGPMPIDDAPPLILAKSAQRLVDGEPENE